MVQAENPPNMRSASRSRLPWHIITCEYPPQSGGVSDYTYILAKGIASRGDEVHVWCPSYSQEIPQVPGVSVHPKLGSFSPGDLLRVGQELDRYAAPRRLLLQWVPHGFGYKSLNLGFCLWLGQRSLLRKDHVELMVHEPFLPFQRGQWRQNAAALVHRLMAVVLLQSAEHVWVSTPSWEKLLRPYAWGRHHQYNWLPLPSNVRRIVDRAAIRAIRDRYAPEGLLVGHFGTFGPLITPLLRSLLPPFLTQAKSTSMLLIGGGSIEFKDSLVRQFPELRDVIYATGHMNAGDPRLSLHLSACDSFLQPYPDGVTSRRTTLMAVLAHGRPTITTAGVLTEPFWRLSRAVELLPVDDNDAFVQAALGLLANPQQRLALEKAALEFYNRQFDIEHIVDLVRSGPHNYDHGAAQYISKLR